MNNYNGETDFLNWYKKNYGVDYDNNVGLSKKEGMSDIDYRIGTNLKGFYDLNNSYQKNKETDLANRNKYYDEQVGLLQNQYGMAVDSLDSNKRIAQQNASIGLDKLKKYLPTQIKSQGLGGLGVSESSMLQAYNKYNNDMGDIAGNYNSNKANLESNKINQISSLENYRQDNLNDINQKYSDYEQSLMGEAKSSTDLLYEKYLSEQEAQKKEHQDMLNNDILYKIEQGYGYGYNSLDELKGYYDSIKDSLSPEQRKVIDDRILTIENSPTNKTEIENAEKEAKFNEIKTGDVSFNNNGGWWIFGKTDYSSGDNFSVNDAGGKKYHIESGGEVSDTALRQAAVNVGNGDIFGYQEKIYYKVGGKIYLIQKRANSYADDYKSLYKKYYG